MTRYILRRFYDTINKSTGNLWSTKEVLLNVLQNNLPWLPPGSTLHRMIKIYFSVAVDTADIEHLMSVFSLQDNALNQHSTPAHVEQMVRIKKESAPWHPLILIQCSLSGNLQRAESCHFLQLLDLQFLKLASIW